MFKTLHTVFFILLLAGVMIGFQCKSKKAVTGNIDVKEKVQQAERIPKIIVDKSFKGDSLGAIINIDTATTKGDTLFLKVSYSGGCKEHKFKLYWNGGYMKSMPPQAKLYLFHNNNGDVCRRLIKETIKFNVSPIQYQGQHTVILSVNKYKQRIKYKY